MSRAARSCRRSPLSCCAPRHARSVRPGRAGEALDGVRKWLRPRGAIVDPVFRGSLARAYRAGRCPGWDSRFEIRSEISLKLLKRLARAVGFEPTTNRLTADCSTAELRPNVPAKGEGVCLVAHGSKVNRVRGGRNSGSGPLRGRWGVKVPLPPTLAAPLVGAIENAIGSAVAGVAEPVDAQVSKTCSCKGVSVRSRPPAPQFRAAPCRSAIRRHPVPC
jgi:hypothetical protein